MIRPRDKRVGAAARGEHHQHHRDDEGRPPAARGRLAARGPRLLPAVGGRGLRRGVRRSSRARRGVHRVGRLPRAGRCPRAGRLLPRAGRIVARCRLALGRIGREPGRERVRLGWRPRRGRGRRPPGVDPGDVRLALYPGGLGLAQSSRRALFPGGSPQPEGRRQARLPALFPGRRPRPPGTRCRSRRRSGRRRCAVGRTSRRSSCSLFIS